MAPFIQESDKGLFLQLHIQPNASKDEVIGLHGERLKIQLKSPPVDGKANQHLISFFSKLLGIPKRCITLTKGETSRQKTLCIESLSKREVLHLLGMYNE